MKKIFSLLYPHKCPLCKSIIKEDELICASCRRKLPLVKEPTCIVCGKCVDEADNGLCYDCRRREHAFVKNRSVFEYRGDVRLCMHEFKYNGKSMYAKFFGTSICDALESYITYVNPDVIIPVPLHKKRLRERGYNQTELLANIIGERFKIPVRNDIIFRKDDTVPQKLLDDRERKNNVKSAFLVTGNELQLGVVMLVDDIFTTGATLDACARELMHHGIKTIYTLTACIGKGC